MDDVDAVDIGIATPGGYDDDDNDDKGNDDEGNEHVEDDRHHDKVDEGINDDEDSHDFQKHQEKQKMLTSSDKKESTTEPKPTPMSSANIFSRYVTFWWISPLLSLGSKQPIQESDLYSLRPDESTGVLGDHLQREWDKEVYKSENASKKPSLTKAIIRTFGFRYALLGFFAIITDALRIIQPLFLGYLVGYFAIGSPTTQRDAFLFAFGVAVCSFLNSFLITPFTFLRQLFGMRVRVACTALVYNKVLKLSHAAISKTSTGTIVNLVSTDTQKFDWASFFLHYIILGPIEALIVLVLLWREVGPASLAGMGVILLLVPMQMKMGAVLMKLRRRATAWTDQRVKVMNEIISGMNIIKMYTWEIPFSERLGNIRVKELSWFLKLASVRGLFMAFFFSSSALISYVTFLTYVLTGNALYAQKVFTVVSLFNSVRITMTLFFPIGITLMNEGRVSIERIEKVLCLDELKSQGLVTSNLRPKPEQCGIVAENAKASWNEALPRPTLSDINFNISQGELLAIVGSVGSGKSSLLMSILGELPLSSGTITVKGKIAYSSQQPWIYNGSVRNNIIFGNEFNEARYNEVITACALERDIQLLSEGDMTLVGERGVALSGGQKARVNLARAVYSDADVYLLDDPLSAVDANVGRHLFNLCICGYLADKPRILVTHQTQYLKDADQLMALSEGECIAKGTYQDLCRAGVDFMTLCAEPEEEHDSAIEDDESEPEAATPEFKRQFSRQLSISRQFSRQDSIAASIKPEGMTSASSCNLNHRMSQMLESTMSVASAEVDVYEENLVPKETKQEGAVTGKTYLAYLKSLHSMAASIGVIVLFLVTQVVYMLADWWLSAWCNQEEQYYLQMKASQQTNSTVPPPEDLQQDTYLIVYSVLAIGLVILAMTRTQLFFRLTIAGSRSLHVRMFNALIKAPSYFFDTNSIGRILNRFSKDMSLVDDMMSFMVCDCLQTAIVVVGILCLVAANNPITFAVVIPIVIAFWYLRTYYMKTSREVKRIEGLSRSPVFGHFSTTLLGLDTIRAFGVEQTFTDQMNSYQDKHTKAWMTFISSSAWLSFRLDLLCVIFISFVALISPALKNELSAGVVGLTLSYAIMISGVFQQCVKQSAEVENLMTSVERILEYAELEPEAAPETDVKPDKGWPDKGEVTFENMSFTYHKSLPRVLHNISLCIKPTEKIGVVGRTGAGKSSLLSTLFRLAEPIGLIEIDGLDIRRLGLRDLRSKLSIIPQEPVIFSGTMRKNIDPFDEYSEDALWNALEEVQLKGVVEELPGKMDAELAEGGSNFSVGQRQLVCLARAILRHSKILVIDEATANVDPRTDALIQATIRDKFKQCTVLTIAHRLHTIMDSDRVIVLDAGNLKEFDAPYVLLKDAKSIFSSLVNQTGPEETRKLFEVARESYYNRKAIPEDAIDGGESLEEAETEAVKPEDEAVKPEDEANDEETALIETRLPDVEVVAPNGDAKTALQMESNL